MAAQFVSAPALAQHRGVSTSSKAFAGSPPASDIPSEIPPRLDAAPAPRSSLLKTILALLDQVVVSGGNFAINVLLARGLQAGQLGVFALLMDAILFLNSLQSALLIYPLNVKSATMQESDVPRIGGSCLLLTLLLTLPLGGALLAYGAFIGVPQVGLWAVLAQTCWQCQETLRRLMLARGNYVRALPGDIVSYLGQGLIVLLLVNSHRVNVSYAFGTIAVTSLAAAALQAFQLRLRPRGPRATLDIGRRFMKQGRWVLLANLTTVVTTVSCSYTLARSHTEAAVGQYQAVLNLLRPVNPLMITLSTLIIPAAAQASSMGGLRAASRVTLRYACHAAAILAPYWLVMLVFPQAALSILYGSSSGYRPLTTEVRLFVGISAVSVVGSIVAAMFNGVQRSRRAMTGQFVGVIATLAITLPLIVKFGLRGAVVGNLISNGAAAVALLYLFFLRLRHEPKAQAC
jgi:O-antigen/teichoic acid export membrane protein